jgi:molecular chaperone DnaJ
VEIIAADGTENTLTITACNDTANNKAAAIWSKDKILLSGKGTLNVIATGDGCRGIKAKKDITIEDLTLNVTTSGNHLGEKPYSFGDFGGFGGGEMPDFSNFQMPEGGFPDFGGFGGFPGFGGEANDSTRQGGFGGFPNFGGFGGFPGFGGEANDSTRQGGFGGFPNFGGFGGFDDFGFTSKPKEVKGKSLKIKVELTLEEIFNGVNKKFNIKRFEKCDHCGGSGMTPESRKKTCKSCGGTGTVFSTSTDGFMRMSMRQGCPTCGGSGYVIENPCNHCGGTGIVQKVSTVDIKIDKGILPGNEIRYTGLGNAAPNGKGPNGDLFVLIVEKPHNLFDREGDNLIFNIEVPVIDAMLGCEVVVPTIEGKKLTAKIPQGTIDGTTLRFKGYGLQALGKATRGDMLGVVKLILPTKLNKEEKEILSKLKESENFK